MNSIDLLKEICNQYNISIEIIEEILIEEKKQVYKKSRNIRGTLKNIVENYLQRHDFGKED